MRVLMITGDPRFGPGHPRYEMQKNAVEELALICWGRGSIVPRIPAGRFDVVTAQDPFFRGLYAWHLARRLSAKFNVQVHADLDGQSFFKRTLARFVLSRADSVRVVSESIKRQVEALGVRATITVLPVFVDLSTFRAVAHEPHAQKTILWFGRFEPEKDPLSALAVLRRVRESVDATLIMLGKGSLESELRRQTKNLPVECPGWQNPAPFLARADVVLCTSRHESWGASMVEALAAGVPVVAPDVGIAREAGAIVVPRERLAHTVAEVLTSGAQGKLRLSLLGAAEWATRWRETLL